MSDQIKQESRIPEKKPRKFFGKTPVKVIVAVILILFAVITLKEIAMAKHFHKFYDGPHGFIKDGPHGFIIEQIAGKLNLDENQKAQVDKIREQINEKMEANKPDRKNDLDEFENEFKKDNLDKNTLKQIMEKKDQKREEMKDFMLDKLIEFHKILTPEQRTKAVEIMKELKDKFHDKAGKDKFNKGPRPER